MSVGPTGCPGILVCHVVGLLPTARTRGRARDSVHKALQRPDQDDTGGRKVYCISTDLSLKAAQISHAKGASTTAASSVSTR